MGKPWRFLPFLQMVAWIGVLISLGKSLGRLGYPGTSCHAKKHTGGYSGSIDVFCDRVQCECGVREGEIVMCACADRVRRIQASLGKSHQQRPLRRAERSTGGSTRNSHQQKVWTGERHSSIIISVFLQSTSSIEETVVTAMPERPTTTPSCKQDYNADPR